MQQMNTSNSAWNDAARQYQEGYQHDDYEPQMRDARDWKADSGLSITEQRERMRQELLTEMQVTRALNGQGRIALAIASVIVVACLFGFLVLALIAAQLTSSTSIALGWGIVICCVAIIAVNGYYNWASTVIARGRGQSANDSQQPTKSK